MAMSSSAGGNAQERQASDFFVGNLRAHDNFSLSFSSDHGGQGGRSDEAPRGSEEEGGVPNQGNRKFLIFILNN